MTGPANGPANGAAAIGRLTLGTWGLLVWSAAFLLLYGGLSLGCAAGAGEGTLWQSDMLALALAGVWAVHLILHALPFLRRGRSVEPPDDFLRRLMRLLAIVGAAATLWIGLPILLLPPCW